jgi:hypothetical protein
MSKKNFMIAMGQIDDQILDRYLQEDERLSAPIPFAKRPWVRIAALAACLVLIVTGIFLLLPSTTNEPTISMTVTIEDVLSVIPMMESVPTTSYSQITLPYGKYPDYLPLVQQDTLPVYKNNRIHIPLSESAFSRFAFKTLNGFAAAFGTDPPQYTITDKTQKLHEMCQEYNLPFDLFTYAYLKGDVTLGDILVILDQSGSMYNLYLGNLKDQSFDGKPLTINPNLGDDQIIASLESVKQRLFEIFGESYPDILISRRDSIISVYYYNANDPVNTWILERSQINRPIINCIALNYHLEADQTISSLSIDYRKSLVSSEKIYSTIDLPMRSLEDAEEWLNKGYVFGGYGCPLCMAEQTPVDFEDYDFVGIQYLHDYIYMQGGATHIRMAIPFYVFYKVIETTDTTTTYAYTYVPAVEIEGMEEYFAKKYSHHDS